MSVSHCALGGARARAGSRLADYLELAKPRITALVVMTTCVGFVLGARGAIDVRLLAGALAGTALVCGGASALNQVWERERDLLMLRTRRRPLPAARLAPAEAMVFGIGLAVAGLLVLAVSVNLLATLVAGLTLAIYLFAYTPLKTRTWLCTVVGAVPGALPPVIGWAAARGDLGGGAWALFAIQFVWQLPHFYAIAWMYREDYARGGFPMLGVIDPAGRRTALEIVSWAAALLPASLLPALLGLVGPLYAAGALVLGSGFLVLAVGMALGVSEPHARRVFLGSILYLPVLLGLSVVDRMAGS